MRRPQIRRDSTPLAPSTAVCLGAFDGLHLGHRALIERARAHAQHVALVTFDPHPQRVLAPDRPLRLLLTAEQRERTAAALGIDALVLLPFDAALARVSAEDFVRDHLARLAPTAIVVGADFRFGAGRRGDAAMLQALLPSHGIAVEVVEPVESGAVLNPGAPQQKLSSSAVRDAVVAGQVARAHAMLGRPHAVIGTVVEGDHRGRTLGFPTANLETGPPRHAEAALLPAVGVYAVWLTPVPSPLRAPLELVGPLPAVANLGTNPTFAGARAPRLEVHVIDRDLGDTLYGTTVEVWFVERLRDELRFPGVDALVAQIKLDIDSARARLDTASDDGVLAPPMIEDPQQ